VPVLSARDIMRGVMARCSQLGLSDSDTDRVVNRVSEVVKAAADANEELRKLEAMRRKWRERSQRLVDRRSPSESPSAQAMPDIPSPSMKLSGDAAAVSPPGGTPGGMYGGMDLPQMDMSGPASAQAQREQPHQGTGDSSQPKPKPDKSWLLSETIKKVTKLQGRNPTMSATSAYNQTRLDDLIKRVSQQSAEQAARL